MDTLGIIVKSVARYDWIFKLTAAAFARGKAVRIHFTDRGVLLLRDFDIRELIALARVTVCEQSAREQDLDETLRTAVRKLLVPSDESLKMITECDRHVVL